VKITIKSHPKSTATVPVVRTWTTSY